MSRHQFLRALHRKLAPRTYLEIGVSDGRSMALSRARSIGVDPAFKVTAPVCCDLELVRATSDDFFAERPTLFDGTVVDLAFIDGLHVAEFAFRDFFNVERRSGATSVIVLDDMLPRSSAEAARVQCRGAWAGDVFKVAELLRQHRPDLTVVPVNTLPTGVVFVVGLDPASRVLSDHYDALLDELQAGDPQVVPSHVLSRIDAADARSLAGSGLWSALRTLRKSGEGDDGGDQRAAVATAIRGELAR